MLDFYAPLDNFLKKFLWSWIKRRRVFPPSNKKRSGFLFKPAVFSVGIMFFFLSLISGIVLAGEEQKLLEIEIDEIVIYHTQDWLGHGHLEEIFYLFPVESQNEDFMTDINFIIEEKEKEVEEKFWGEQINNLEASLKDFSLEKREEVEINGRKGYKLVFTGYLPDIFADEIKWLQVITFLPEGKHLFSTYTASEENFPEYQEEAMEIIFKTEIR